MLKSMTGFGRYQEIIGGRDILVEIRSVNHRYYEFSARLPRAYGYLEEKLKSFLNGRVARGKTEISLTLMNVEGKDALIEVNELIAEGYVNALRKANERLGLKDDITLSHIMRLPDIFNVRKPQDNEDEIWESVKTVAERALDNFIEMREAEGLRMKEDFLNRLSYIEELVSMVEERSPEVNKAYRERLENRLKDILGDKNIEESRILTEAAIFADKTAVDEETVRLRSHINQFRSMLELDEPVGRKLDFLIQEFNREANTIGSKAQDASVTKIVVELKSEIEKIREQIQNIE
ncbi:MAG: YicC family protein [Oscillospiraceae bacterium]|nr:YicC family protein [Oscillospiraceae bacterium]